MAFQKPEFVMEILSRKKKKQLGKAKTEGMEQGTNRGQVHIGGTESAGAIPVGRARLH